MLEVVLEEGLNEMSRGEKFKVSFWRVKMVCL